MDSSRRWKRWPAFRRGWIRDVRILGKQAQHTRKAKDGFEFPENLWFVDEKRRMSMIRICPPSPRRCSKKRWLLILFVLLLMVFPASAQERTVGVLVNTEAAYEGYTLFSPMNTPSVYLMDNEGRIIHTWEIEGKTGVLSTQGYQPETE